MNKILRLFLAAIYFVGLFGMTGCSEHLERYEDPSWLGGSSIETLEERGNYTIFLSLMEKANYKEPISKQLFTLFVPDDDAFQDYFSSEGINSVEDLTEDEAVQLFTLHVLRNPRSRFYLIYEYIWSELQTPKAEYAALFHRKETPSTSMPYKETIRYVPGKENQEVLMYTDNKYVPLWSYEFFGDFGGAQDGSDYLFMYPESTWEEGYPSDVKGLNWHNAMVIPNPEIPEELEVRTASGFIYFLDRVVAPMPSIEEYLKANQDKYGLYYDLMQYFAEYGGQQVDEQRRVLYQKSYDLIFNLADEYGPESSAALPRSMWTAFIPPDDVLQEYLDNTIMQYYDSISAVPSVTLYYILQSQLSAALVVPSKLKNGYFNAFGDPTNITKDDISTGFMCSNGVVYESKRVFEPNVFKCVPGMLFFDQNYSTLLYVLNESNMLTTISNPDADVTVFATTNEKLEEYGIRYNETNDVVESRGPIDGKWGPMKSTDLTVFAQDQIYKGILPDASTNQGFARMSSGNYIKYGNNQIVAAENQIFNEPANVQDVIVNELNGHLIKVDRPIESRVVIGKILTGNDDEPRYLADPEFSDFAELLIDTRLLDSRYKDPITKENIPNLKFFAASDFWTAFIPTNEAMAEARAAGLIPEDTDSLKNFLTYHFIKDDVIFDDGEHSGTFETPVSFTDPFDGSTQYYTLDIANSPGDLIITDVTGRVVPVEHEDANILVRKGVVHKINSVLNFYE